MAMVDTVYWLPIGGPAVPADWLGPKVGGHLAPFLYSSREPSELSQWLCHDDSTINIVVVIIIIIIIIIMYDHTVDGGMDRVIGIILGLTSSIVVVAYRRRPRHGRTGVDAFSIVQQRRGTLNVHAQCIANPQQIEVMEFALIDISANSITSICCNQLYNKSITNRKLYNNLHNTSK